MLGNRIGISCSDRAVHWTNGVAVTALIGGLALAILASGAAARFHTHTLYFFAPGMGAAGASFIVLVIANCCRKKAQNQGQDRSDNQASGGGPAHSEAGQGIKDENQNGGPGSSDGDTNSGESKNPVTGPGSSAASKSGEGGGGPKASGPPETKGDQSKTASMGIANVWYKIEGCEQKLNPMVSAPFPVEKALTFEDASYTSEQNNALKLQRKCLDQHYYYQRTEGKGDCFYIAVASGVLHQMVAEKSQDKTIQTLSDLLSSTRTLMDGKEIMLTDQKISEEHQTVLTQLHDVKNLETLTQFLSSREKVEALVMLLRQIGYQYCPDAEDQANILTKRNWADFIELTTLAEYLGYQRCILPEHDYFPNTEYGVIGDHETQAPFLIINRAQAHFDVMIRKDLLVKIGVPGATSAHDYSGASEAE